MFFTSSRKSRTFQCHCEDVLNEQGDLSSLSSSHLLIDLQFCSRNGDDRMSEIIAVEIYRRLELNNRGSK